MKLLMTGATGFLGKRLLEMLLSDPRIEKIWVTSRNKRTHPSPKVQVLQIDLSDPGLVLNIDILPDAVIHLAGLYDFEENYESCYTQNVLPTLHLAKRVREWNQAKRVPLLFASTYAVTYGQPASVSESPLIALPPTNLPYAYTKAVAERAITDSSIPSAVFRLGILVGSSKDGATDKLDGAYSFVQFVDSARSFLKLVRNVPIPGKPDGILPLVPVDCAAKVFHEALFRPEVAQNPAQIYGVYDSSSIPVREFSESVFKNFAPGSKALFFAKIPESIIRFQSRFTPISSSAFKFSVSPVEVENNRFQRTFSQTLVPHFRTYEDAFYSGYRLMSRGST